MPSPSHAIFVSESCRREYVEAGYELHESPVIYNGIDLRRFHPPEARGSGAPLRLLCIGRIEAAKGQHLVVDALAELRPHHPSAFHLDIVGPVGDADYRDQLVTTITSKGLSDCISILDPVSYDDAPDCYRAHDVLVFPSVGPERFPLVILEAMATGLAVISTLTGGHREVLEHERNSLVVRSPDTAELARQLDRLAREPDLRARIAQAGMETVRPEYGLEAKRDEIAALLTEVSARTPSSNSN